MTRVGEQRAGASVFHAYAGSSLTVVQPSLWKQRYELRDGDATLATLTFTKLIGCEAEAVSEEGSWTIRQSGLWKSRLTLTASGSEDPLIAFPIRLLKHRFPFTLGDKKHERLMLQRDFLGTTFTLAGTMNRPLVHLTTGLLQFSPATLSIGDRGDAYEELPALVFLAWYFSVVVRRTRYHAH